MAVAIVLFLATATLAVGLVGASVEADERSLVAAQQTARLRPLSPGSRPSAGDASKPRRRRCRGSLCHLITTRTLVRHRFGRS